MAIRQKVRLKHLDAMCNVGYNLINGSERVTVDVPLHYRYNPPDNPITGVRRMHERNGHAGLPVRGQPKEFGKKYLKDLNDWLYEPAGVISSSNKSDWIYAPKNTLTPDLMMFKDFRHQGDSI
jgi:hypothetical protein